MIQDRGMYIIIVVFATCGRASGRPGGDQVEAWGLPWSQHLSPRIWSVRSNKKGGPNKNLARIGGPEFGPSADGKPLIKFVSPYFAKWDSQTIQQQPVNKTPQKEEVGESWGHARAKRV